MVEYRKIQRRKNSYIFPAVAEISVIHKGAAFYVSPDIYSSAFKGFHHYGSRGDKSSRNTSRKMTASPVIFKSPVFTVGRIIGVRRSCYRSHGLIVAAFCIFIFYYYRKECARGSAVKHSADYINLVGLAPFCGNFSCRSALSHSDSYVIIVYGDSRGDSVDYGSYGRAVAFSEYRYGQCAAE